MNKELNTLIEIAKRLSPLQISHKHEFSVHPFDERNIHTDIATVSKALFDDGHYAQATFEGFKVLEIRVKASCTLSDTGFKLMMSAFNESAPKIKLTALSTPSEIDEQSGFRHVFAGTMSAIRNPRAHDIITDHIDTCLDHLSLASVLLRRMNQAGYF